MASLRKFKPLTRSETKKGGHRLTPALERTKRKTNKPSACIQLTFDSPPKSNKISPEIKITGCNADQLNEIILAVSPILNPHSPLQPSPYEPPKVIPLSPISSSPLNPSSHSTPSENPGPTGNSIALDNTCYSFEASMTESVNERKNDSDRVRNVLDHYHSLSKTHDSELDYTYSCEVTNPYSLLSNKPKQVQVGRPHNETPPSRSPSSKPPCNKNKGRNVGAAFTGPAKSKHAPQVRVEAPIVRMSPADLPGVRAVPLNFGVHADRPTRNTLCKESAMDCVTDDLTSSDVTEGASCATPNCDDVNANVAVLSIGVNETECNLTGDTSTPDCVNRVASPRNVSMNVDIDATKTAPQLSKTNNLDCVNDNTIPRDESRKIVCGMSMNTVQVHEVQNERDFVPMRVKTAPARIRANTRNRHSAKTRTETVTGPISPISGPSISTQSKKSMKVVDDRPTRSDASKCATSGKVCVPNTETLAERAKEDLVLEKDSTPLTKHTSERTVVISEDIPLPSCTDTAHTLQTETRPPISERIVTMGKISDRPAPESLISSDFEDKLKKKNAKLEKENTPNLPHWRVILKEKPSPQNSLFKCSKTEAFEKLKNLFGEGLCIISKWSHAKKHKKITVQASSEEQYQKLINAKNITQSDTFQLHTSIDETRIWGCAKVEYDKTFPKEIKVEGARDIQGNTISDHDGKFEHRLNMMSEENWVGSKKGVFTFACDYLPKKIKIGGKWVDVKPYEFQARHCQRCTSYTHSTRACEKFKIGDPICAFCSGSHLVKNCEFRDDATKARCSHCKENHPVWHPQCPIRKKERLANKYRAGTRMYRMKSLKEISAEADKTNNNTESLAPAGDVLGPLPETDTVTPCENTPQSPSDSNIHVDDSEIASPDPIQKILVSMFALLDYIIGKSNLNAPELQNLICKDLEIDTKYSGLYKNMRSKILDQAQG